MPSRVSWLWLGSLPCSPSHHCLSPRFAAHSACPSSMKQQRGFVLLGFQNTQISCFPASTFHGSGACAGGPAHGFCMLWKAIPFLHLSCGGLQVPLAREEQILHCHKFPVQHLKPGLCRQSSPTAFPLCSPSSSCLSDLSFLHTTASCLPRL